MLTGMELNFEGLEMAEKMSQLMSQSQLIIVAMHTPLQKEKESLLNNHFLLPLKLYLWLQIKNKVKGNMRIQQKKLQTYETLKRK